MRYDGITPQDLSSSGGILASDDSVAQLSCDGDKIEGRAGAGHDNARDGHKPQGIEVMISALVIVELKGGYSVGYDLSLYVGPIGEDFVGNEHKEDES